MATLQKLVVLGKVVEKLAPKIALVEVPTNELDNYIRMFYTRFGQYRADDPTSQTKVGDLVLIKSKDKPERLDLLHEVSEVVVRAGQLRDPLTGKRVIGDRNDMLFLEDLDRINRLLPDFVERPGLVYKDTDLTAGSPQSPRDKS